MTHASISTLLEFTQQMLYAIVTSMTSSSEADSNRSKAGGLRNLNKGGLAQKPQFFMGPYKQIDFMLGLSDSLGRELPDLDAESATAELVKILEENEITLPSQPTLPRLLDKLSATYLEPQCVKPTWIINHPECLSPLSKSFLHPSPRVAKPVAARAELFIFGREIVNCYEEENSPFEQKRKFRMQQRYAAANKGQGSETGSGEIDEDYVKALEWGLPPTAGWGCGIDRLIMLICGRERINDVLAFGNLRSVTRNPEKRNLVRIAKSPLDFKKASLAQENLILEPDPAAPGINIIS
jgi:lysyl-tRNA synthetase, class II